MYWTSLSFLSLPFYLQDEIDVYKDTEKMNRQEKVKERGECSVTLTEHARSLYYYAWPRRLLSCGTTCCARF